MTKLRIKQIAALTTTVLMVLSGICSSYCKTPPERNRKEVAAYDHENYIEIYKSPAVLEHEAEDGYSIAINIVTDQKSNWFHWTPEDTQTTHTMGNDISAVMYASKYKVWIISHMGQVSDHALLIDLKSFSIVKSYMGRSFLPCYGSDHILFTLHNRDQATLLCDGILVYPRSKKSQPLEGYPSTTYLTGEPNRNGQSIFDMRPDIDADNKSEIIHFGWLSKNSFFYQVKERKPRNVTINESVTITAQDNKLSLQHDSSKGPKERSASDQLSSNSLTRSEPLIPEDQQNIQNHLLKANRLNDNLYQDPPN